MTVWFVIPATRFADLRVAYLLEKVRGRDNPGEDEQIGVMQPNRAGTKMFTGTTRLSPAVLRRLRASKPAWLEVYTAWPPPGGWEYPSN